MLFEKSIGVVIATYNGEKYVKEQIESVISQTIKPDKIVISDGGSSDNTVSICKATLANSGIDYNVIVSDIHLSVRNNFQKGLINCDSDIIFFADQDDVWDRSKLEITLRGFVNNNVCMVFTNASIVDENLEGTGESLWNSIGYKCNDGQYTYKKFSTEYLNILCKHNIVTGMCMAITRGLKEFVLPFSENSIHDVWIAFLAIFYGDVVAISDKCVQYRQHGNNVIGATTSVSASLKHKSGYAQRVRLREKFILDVLNKVYTIQCENVSQLLEEYKSFISKRIAFIDKKVKFTFPITDMDMYKKYEYKYRQIILKDYITRLSCPEKDKGMDVVVY